MHQETKPSRFMCVAWAARLITACAHVLEEALHQLIPGQLGHVLPADEDELILGCRNSENPGRKCFWSNTAVPSPF